MVGLNFAVGALASSFIKPDTQKLIVNQQPQQNLIAYCDGTDASIDAHGGMEGCAEARNELPAAVDRAHTNDRNGGSGDERGWFDVDSEDREVTGRDTLLDLDLPNAVHVDVPEFVPVIGGAGVLR